MTDADLPIIHARDIEHEPPGDSTTVLGVVLASGMSERFGEANKLLTVVDGEALVARAVESFLESDLDEIIVVIGHEAEAVSDALDHFDIEFVENPHFKAGQSTAVRAGVQLALDRDADAVIFGLGDMPAVQPETIDLLRDAFDRDIASIIAPAYQGQRGNPVLFSSKHFDALTTIEGDTGGRSLIYGSDDVVCIEMGDPGVCYDIDRPEDHRG